MLIEMLLGTIFTFVRFLITLIPNVEVVPSYISSTLQLLSIPLSIFPFDLWIIVIGNIGIWYVVHLGWAVIEWLYKKLPGIN